MRAGAPHAEYVPQKIAGIGQLRSPRACSWAPRGEQLVQPPSQEVRGGGPPSSFVTGPGAPDVHVQEVADEAAGLGDDGGGRHLEEREDGVEVEAAEELFQET